MEILSLKETLLQRNIEDSNQQYHWREQKTLQKREEMESAWPTIPVRRTRDSVMLYDKYIKKNIKKDQQNPIKPVSHKRLYKIWRELQTTISRLQTTDLFFSLRFAAVSARPHSGYFPWPSVLFEGTLIDHPMCKCLFMIIIIDYWHNYPLE